MKAARIARAPRSSVIVEPPEPGGQSPQARAARVRREQRDPREEAESEIAALTRYARAHGPGGIEMRADREWHHEWDCNDEVEPW